MTVALRQRQPKIGEQGGNVVAVIQAAIEGEGTRKEVGGVCVLFVQQFHARQGGEHVRFAQPGADVGIDRQRRPICLLYTSPSPRDRTRSRMPSSA